MCAVPTMRDVLPFARRVKGCVPACRLLRVVGGRVAPDHVRRRVAEQVLHIQLASVLLDRLGREHMAATASVHLRDASPLPQSAKHLFEPIGLEADAWLEPAVVGRPEEGTGFE